MSYTYHINVLLSSIINQTNKNVALIPKEARELHHTGTGALNGSHDAQGFTGRNILRLIRINHWVA